MDTAFKIRCAGGAPWLCGVTSHAESLLNFGKSFSRNSGEDTRESKDEVKDREFYSGQMWVFYDSVLTNCRLGGSMRVVHPRVVGV